MSSDTEHRDGAAQRDFQEAGHRGRDRALPEFAGKQEHDDRGKRRDPKGRPARGGIGERRNRQGQHRPHRQRPAVGNEQRNETGIDRAYESAQHVFQRGADRAADTRLRDDHGGQDGPKPVQGNRDDLREGEGRQGRYGHPKTEPDHRIARRTAVSGAAGCRQSPIGTGRCPSAQGHGAVLCEIESAFRPEIPMWVPTLPDTDWPDGMCAREMIPRLDREVHGALRPPAAARGRAPDARCYPFTPPMVSPATM